MSVWSVLLVYLLKTDNPNPQEERQRASKTDKQVWESNCGMLSIGPRMSNTGRRLQPSAVDQEPSYTLCSLTRMKGSTQTGVAGCDLIMS